MHKVLLTFDTEDFTNTNSVVALKIILDLLGKYGLKGIFFITGHMAEKLQNFPTVVSLLNRHEIGYHSSAHSVHPAIFEFTDISNYEQAYKISMAREISHINPLTGKIEGRGGIHAVKDLFPAKQIVSYRAPGCCWSPPHTQALLDLGIRFDFSSNLSAKPILYKNLTFYPYPIVAHWQGRLIDYRILLLSILKNEFTVIGLHPSLFLNQNEWDLIYQKGNPARIIPPKTRRVDEAKALIRSFSILLKQIRWLKDLRIIEVCTNLSKPESELIVTQKVIERCYEENIRWATRVFSYEPKFIRSHFFRFFDLPLSHD